jgi:hypothetical protein
MARESEKLYRQIIDGNYDPRLKRSLEHIKEVCDTTEEHGGRIYVSRIGELCKKEYQGPTAQSIRNQKDTLKKYVDLRAAEQQFPADAGRKESKLKISDPKVRAYILILEEQVRDSEERFDILKNFFQRLAPVEIDQLIADAFRSGTPLALPPMPNGLGETQIKGIALNEAARRALEKLTSESHLKPFGLSLYKGRVLSETKRTFLDKGEYKALLDLIAARESDQVGEYDDEVK